MKPEVKPKAEREELIKAIAFAYKLCEGLIKTEGYDKSVTVLMCRATFTDILEREKQKINNK